jgi:hypothetical protein
VRLVSAHPKKLLTAKSTSVSTAYLSLLAQCNLLNVQVIEETAVFQELGQDVHVIRCQTHTKQLHDIGMTQLANGALVYEGFVIMR